MTPQIMSCELYMFPEAPQLDTTNSSFLGVTSKNTPHLGRGASMLACLSFLLQCHI